MPHRKSPNPTLGCGFNWYVAIQTTIHAAAHGGEVFIRKMRPFEETHTLASHKYALVEFLYGVLNAKSRPLGGILYFPTKDGSRLSRKAFIPSF